MKSKNLIKKLGLASLAVLCCAVDRGSLLLEEILAGPGRNLTKSLKRINIAKDVSDYYKTFEKLSENNARVIISRLKKKGLISKNGNQYMATDMGKVFVDKFLRGQIPVAWDGKWRMIFFDIPEKRRSQRIWLNARLTRIGYRPIQKSVLIGKYPPDAEFIEELLEHNLYQCVRVITVGEIDDDKILEG